VLAASAVFNECFPERWGEAMAALADKIAAQVRDQSPPDAAPLRLVPTNPDEQC
jgi:hypothetical protein